MLLASDFDGTLFVEDNKILKENIRQINRFRSKNNIFVIITGRGLYSIKKELIKNDIKYDYLICNNGAMIYDSKDRILSKTYLEEKDIFNIIKIIKRDKLEFVFDIGKGFSDNLDCDLTHISSIYLNKKTVLFPEETLKEIDNKTNTYNYISPNWINITNIKVNKLNSLKEFLEIINYKSLVFTIGDAINDVDMIKEFNGGVMKIHEEELNELTNKNYDNLSDYIKELI